MAETMRGTKTKTLDSVEMKDRIEACLVAEFERRRDEFPSYTAFIPPPSPTVSNASAPAARARDTAREPEPDSTPKGVLLKWESPASGPGTAGFGVMPSLSRHLSC